MMRLAIMCAALVISQPAYAAERRCGWIDNPTPGNWSLDDKNGTWYLGAQGTDPIDGMELIPDMENKQWVRTNGSYGYGCGCLTMDVNHKNRQVIRVLSARQLPLKICRADRKLPKR
jgi:Protein of unknown function (DUF4087)